MSAALEGKVCLVTGASRGIGAAIAVALAGNGARIAVHYGRNQEKALEVVGRLHGNGHFTITADLEQPQNARRIVDETLAHAGHLDILVNNAGIYEPHPPLEVDGAAWLENWRRTLAVNLQSPAALCHAAASVMAEQGSGRIINIGSRGAFRGEPECPAYGASKAGLHAMSQSLAIALAPANVLVYAVAPGFVATDMAEELLEGEGGDAIRAQSPFRRVARPEEIAEVVCFLASSEGQFLSGSIVDVNGASYLRH
ncbi:MAG: SDR family oxidoreductase [Woeseiaceae bacterium]|nr:SDR family oxidoreductase [Woeseiaceae bacterium]